ncbi:MAG: glycoside hydrolase family 3 C-terminal domain-containing protein, partial [Clostridia bacterium]|nr:glycoside hydrolase family 3 C-terminal domain-containing protein [Clostridia bacterium]
CEVCGKPFLRDWPYDQRACSAECRHKLRNDPANIAQKEAKKKTQDAYINEAVEAAKNADVALVFVGLTDVFESEGFDRSHLRIPPEHVALINAVKTANENVVLVLAGGAVIEMPWENNAKAILHSFLGGEAGGSAVVDLLFGDVNPSGKLAETYPYALEDTPCYDYFPGNNTTVEYREGIYIGYRYYDTAKKEVRYPFGYGLSYTTFEYSDVSVSASDIKDTDTVTLKFKVKNTGAVDGAEIAQVYVSKEDSKIFRAEKELRGFKKVYLKAGEEKEIEIDLSKRAFAFYNVEIHDWHVESGKYSVLVGASSRDIRLTAEINVTSTCEKDVPDMKAMYPAYATADVKNITDEQFEKLLGYKIPEKNVVAYPNLTFANTLEDSCHGKNGKKICNLIGKLIGTDGMAYAIAVQTPVKNFISMSMGVFSPAMANRLLDILNDKQPLTWGIVKLIVKALPSVIKGLPELLNNI